jgi:hypothetical protein
VGNTLLFNWQRMHEPLGIPFKNLKYPLSGWGVSNIAAARLIEPAEISMLREFGLRVRSNLWVYREYE